MPRTHRRPTLLLILLTLGGAAASTAVSPASPADRASPVSLGTCATPEFRQLPPPTPASPWAQRGGAADCSASANNPAPEYEPANGLYTVRVAVHVIMDSQCVDGDIPDAMVQTQIDILNEDFLALPGSNGAPGADSQIRFELATEDPDGLPTSGITRHCDDTWFADDGDYWQSIAWDPSRYLNLYSNSAGGARGYVPFLPASSNSMIGDPSDRVVVNWQAFGTDGPVPAHQLGRTATHEIGHYLGLWHVFFGGCGIATPPDCYTTGDLLCDTAPDDAASDLCPIGATSCGGVPVPIENYMEYTDDDCMTGFSAEQGLRMRCTLMHYRPGVFTASSPALFTDGFETGDTSAWSHVVL
ncbi:MAG: zinc metalloprotease [Acidobacteriota bacterium]